MPLLAARSVLARVVASSVAVTTIGSANVVAETDSAATVVKITPENLPIMCRPPLRASRRPIATGITKQTALQGDERFTGAIEVVFGRMVAVTATFIPSAADSVPSETG